jgi:hypothetical protein
VDLRRGDGHAPGVGARNLRPDHRPGVVRCGAVDGCITKAPLWRREGGQKPSIDRGKQGLKRSTVVNASGIPLGAIAAPANRHDSPLLDETLDTLEALGPLPEQMSVHLDWGYD